MPWTPPPLPTSLPERLALIIEKLCEAVAARGVKAGSATPLIVLAWTRLRRLSLRFAALAAAVRDGRLAAARTARGRADPRPARARRAPQAHRLPSGFGWLIRLVPEAPAYRSLVQHWLEEPELATLLARGAAGRAHPAPALPDAGDRAGAGAARGTARAARILRRARPFRRSRTLRREAARCAPRVRPEGRLVA